MDKLIQLIRDLLLSMFAYRAGKSAIKDKYIKERDAKLEKYKKLDAKPVARDEVYDAASWTKT